MALSQYGLSLVSSVCFQAEKVDCMADQKIRSGPSIECKNQILLTTAFNAQPYYKRAMDGSIAFLFNILEMQGFHQDFDYMGTISHWSNSSTSLPKFHISVPKDSSTIQTDLVFSQVSRDQEFDTENDFIGFVRSNSV